MTIATKLFYHWRSRTGRGSEPEPEPEPELNATSRLPRGHRSNGGHHPRENGDSSRRCHPRTQHSRHLSHHRAPSTIWLDRRGTSEFEAGNSSGGGIRSCRGSGLRRTRDESDDGLPGAVVQARARLLERLRSIYVTGSRESTSSLGIFQNERSCSDDLSMIVSGDWEAETQRECTESRIPLAVLTLRTDRALSFCDTSRKPPGLTRDKLGLRQEVFIYAEEGGVAKASVECSICLERFLEGDGMIRLQCGHRFHPSCLEPWLRTHVDCPYCRSSIAC